MMKKEKVKVYIYTRVSTAMQIDGYSLDAQKSRMKAYDLQLQPPVVLQLPLP